MIGLLIALELLDATALVGAVLGTAGVMGIAVGFAFRRAWRESERLPPVASGGSPRR